MTSTSLPQSSPNPDDHQRILQDAREHPGRSYRQHVEAAQEIAAEEYRREIRVMMDAGTLDDEL